LQSRIWEVLHARHIGDGGGLYVYVADRVVTLTGNVETARQAVEVAKVITDFSDVVGFVNDLHIGPAEAA
jgi:osmotically-inducible protein OsmY